MMAADTDNPASGSGFGAVVARLFGWCLLAIFAAFLVDNFLTHWLGLPGAGSAMSAPSALGIMQAGLYGLAVLLAAANVFRRSHRTLREDSRQISDINAFLIRAAFWSVLLIGIVDVAISFVRVEGWLEAMFGEALATGLGRPSFRGTYVHLPLIIASIALAARTRTLGFIWLALLVVVAELLIVIGRFVFSYEQAFMADLVRFWYAALFLFASAYTLLEDGHVRVDVIYAGMGARARGYVNAIGSVLLGISLCTVILIYGMGSKSAIINSPVLSFEVTQASFGLYVKYLMAGFLGIFAVSMMIQFISSMLGAIADIRGEPGGGVQTASGDH